MNLVDINVAITLTLAGAVIALPVIKLTKKTIEKKFRAFLGCVIALLGVLVIINAVMPIP